MRRVVLALLLCISASPVAAQYRSDPPRRAFLFKDARGELAAARARGDTAVTLVVASAWRANARVVQLATSLGGTIRYRDDDVDYLRVRIGLANVERLIASPLVHAADVSISGISRAFGLADAAAAASAPQSDRESGFPAPAPDTLDRWPLPLPETPLVNRYDPLTDLNGVSWRKANPTFDGRGTTIAIIDQNLDPLLPELQVATTLDGKPTRKIIGYETVIDPDDEDDGHWLRMKDSVTVSGRFSWQGRDYLAPAPGTYRIDAIDEAVYDSLSRSQIDKDLNRDGNPPGSSRLFAVLWNEATNDVWVDTDQDLDFSDERAYTDYSVRPEFGVLGRDKPETRVRESVAFGIQIDRARKMVALNVGVASHASLVVGAAVASRGSAGRFDGVAPGAQLVNVAEGGAAYGQTEAVIRAVKHPQVDVVFLEQSSVIARNYLLFDGRLVATIVYGRLIERFGKPIVIPTHNYAVLGAIDDYALAPGAISVGGHESKANFFMVHGVRVQHDDNLLITGGYGPMGNGALKPDIIAPSNYISTGRGFVEGTAIPGLMQLPPGYNIAGGTSTATPTTAASVALLISAAKQRGVKYDAHRLRRAIIESARWVPHLPSQKQGNGVVNIEKAWEALQAMDAQPAATIVVRAPVRHAMSHLLATPDEGVGLYEREGWLVGDSASRVLSLTRTTGAKGATTYAVSLIGNDGTFSVPSTIALARGASVPLTVAVAPKSSGVHSAILALDDPAHPGMELRTELTIVAAESLSSGNGYKVERKVEIPRPGMTHLYYRVPEGVGALKVDVESAKRRVTVAITRPDARNVSGIRQPEAAGKTSYAIASPVAGVWEVRLQDVEDTRTFDWEQAKKAEPVPVTAATVTVTALGGEVRLARTEGAEATLEGVNRLASFSGAITGAVTGSQRSERLSLAGTTQRLYEVDVAPGSTLLMASARTSGDAAVDADLYLFDCTGKECKAARTDGDARGEEVVSVTNPAPGKWKIVLDAFGSADRSVDVDYRDVVLNPAHGSVAVTDQPMERKASASWSARANVWHAGMVPGGRTPFAGALLTAHPKGGDPIVVTLSEIGVAAERAAGASGSR